MSYGTYRDRDRDWDEPRSSVSIKRYVIPPEDNRDRDMVVRRPESHSGAVSRYDDYDPRRYDYDHRSEREYYEREYSEPYDALRSARSGDVSAPVIIPQGQPVIIHKARGPVYINPRESDYDFVHRSETDRDSHHHRHRHPRDYNDGRFRRELSPTDSISQAPRRRDDDYSSDDSMVYVRDHPHHRRHMAEGALVGVGAAELLRNRRRNDGDDVSNGVSRVGQDAGAAALGAVAVEGVSRARDYYRSKSRHRSHSYDDDRGSHASRHSHRHHRHHHSHARHSRSRTRSHSRAKTLAGWGLGAAAVAGAVAFAQNQNKSKDGRRSRSRHRRASSSRRPETRDGRDDPKRSESQRRKHMAGAGLAGAAVAGIADRVHSRSRSRKGGRSKSHSRVRQALPAVVGGLGSAAAVGLYEKNKEKNDGSKRKERRRPRARGSPPPEAYPDPSRDSSGLIEYGGGSVPAAYYGRTATPPSPGYYSDASDPVASGAAGYGSSRGRVRSRSRSRSRGGISSDSSTDSDRGSRRRRRSRHGKHGSRSRKLAGAALAATGVGYAAHEISQHKGRKDANRDRDRPRFEDEVHDPYESHDPYEESYNPMPYPPSPPGAARPIDNNPYPDSNYFPPPPGPGPRQAGNQRPYDPADFPPGAAPQPYGYPPPPGPEPYTSRPRKADEHGYYSHPETPLRTRKSRSPQPKSVAFDLEDPGYQTDDSNSTADSVSSHNSRRHGHSSNRYSSSKKPDARHGRDSFTPKDEGGSPDSSDSTIDLPDRFDSRGRLLPPQESKPTGDPLEELLMKGINKVFA